MNKDMRGVIRNKLAKLSINQNVKILYAVESGSRIWGFESPDSDYDIRFIYIRPTNHYISIDVENKSDVIEVMDGDLDFVGWDIRKALRLLRKSNPALLEWLNSPIVYCDRPERKLLNDVSFQYYSRSAGYYHYLHMAKGNYKKYIEGRDPCWLKKYLYVLRPLLAVQWIKEHLDPPPVSFDVLSYACITDKELQGEVDTLLYMKRQGNEMKTGPRMPAIDKFITGVFESEYVPPKIIPQNSDILNKVFREIIL